jgi:hypothetical protein
LEKSRLLAFLQRVQYKLAGLNNEPNEENESLFKPA